MAYFEGRRIGTGTDLWRLWDQRRAGELSDERWAELESALTLGKGTCNTMGTASTMGALAESLGLAWPGSTSIPAGDGRHATSRDTWASASSPSLSPTLGHRANLARRD